MKIIGLTGGIASGKSTVSNELKKLGALIIDADIVAREIVEPGRPACQEISEAFGEKVLWPDGNINRKKLGEIVFHDEEARCLLNRITHPRIITEIRNRLDLIAAEDDHLLVVVDAALLIEAKIDALVDEVWLVQTSEKEQIARLMKRDNLSYEEAKNRISLQMPLDEKKKYAKYFIDNNGTVSDTIKQVRDLYHKSMA